MKTALTIWPDCNAYYKCKDLIRNKGLSKATEVRIYKAVARTIQIAEMMCCARSHEEDLREE